MKNKLKIINMLNKSYKKILLVISGILIALIILELSLQTAGFVALSYQRYRNNQALKNKSEYKIMCLGESTTYGRYPKSLQKVLDKKYPNKFSVIDCGVIGNTLENILSQLDINISRYNPDFAICMMGINDGFVYVYNDAAFVKNNKYESFKLYKLYRLIKEHLMSLLKNKKAYADNIGRFDMNYAFKLFLQKKYSDAEQVCNKILEIKPDDYGAYSLLAMLYYYHLDKQSTAYKIALKIIKKNKELPDWLKLDQIFIRDAYEIAIDYNLNYKKNIEFSKQLVGQLIDIDYVTINARMYWFIKNIITPEQKIKIFKKMFSSREHIEQYYGLHAIDCMDKKDYKKAEEYFRAAEEIRLKYPNEKTYGLYKLIIKKLMDNNIKVICMQYPLRSIEPLKRVLMNEEYYDKIIFISNENNFKDLLKTKQFKEVFEDQFAGDFGHYRDEGSILMAANIANTLDKLLN